MTGYRKKILDAPIKDGKAVLEQLAGQRREEAEDDDLDWAEEVLGEMEGGYDNCRFSCYWDSDTNMSLSAYSGENSGEESVGYFSHTCPLATGTSVPDTPELMAAAKYWFEQYGAVLRL